MLENPHHTAALAGEVEPYRRCVEARTEPLKMRCVAVTVQMWEESRTDCGAQAKVERTINQILKESKHPDASDVEVIESEVVE